METVLNVGKNETMKLDMGKKQLVYDFVDQIHDGRYELFVYPGSPRYDVFGGQDKYKFQSIELFNHVWLMDIFEDVLKFEKEPEIFVHISEFKYRKTQKGFYAFLKYKDNHYMVGHAESKWTVMPRRVEVKKVIEQKALEKDWATVLAEYVGVFGEYAFLFAMMISMLYTMIKFISYLIF